MQEDMRLVSVIKQWLTENSWDDDVHIDHVEQTAQVKTGIQSESHKFSIYIESEEKRDWLSVFFYSVLTIPENRSTECLHLINHVNMCIGMGRFALTTDQQIQFKVVFDCEGAEITAKVLDNMVAAAKSSFMFWIDGFGKVVFTELSASQIIQEVEKAHNDKNQIRH